MDVVFFERSVTASDGTPLAVRHYEPSVTQPNRSGEGQSLGGPQPALLVIHGVCEHGTRYDHFARFLAERGWRVIVPDLRGHGVSGGVRTHVAHFERYLDDLDEISKCCHVPDTKWVLGHSMGGLAAIRYAQTRPNRLRGLVLSSPLLEVALRVPTWKWVLGRLLVGLFPKTRFRTRIDPKNMSRDAEFQARRKADNLIQRTVTAGWFFAMQQALHSAWRDAGTLKLPIFAMVGGQDKTVRPEAIEKWLNETQSQTTRLLVQPQHVHELLNEGNWRETALALVAWVEHVDANQRQSPAQPG